MARGVPREEDPVMVKSRTMARSFERVEGALPMLIGAAIGTLRRCQCVASYSWQVHKE